MRSAYLLEPKDTECALYRNSTQHWLSWILVVIFTGFASKVWKE